jgi:hypothetical protein
MPNKLLIRYLARPAEILTALVILLLLVFLLQMIARGIEEVLTVRTSREQATDIQNKPKELTTQEKINYSRKQFLPDGTMLFVYSVSRQDDENKLDTEIFDANSNLIWQGVKFNDANNNQVWQGLNNMPLPFKEYLAWNGGYEDRGRGYREIKKHLVIEPDFSESLNYIFNRDGNGREIWQYSFSKEYFTGYTSEHEIIGYFGLNGFVKNKAEVRPFGRLIHWDRQTEDKQLSPPVLWVTDHYVCQVDIPNRIVDVIFKTETSKITKYYVRNTTEFRGRAQVAASTIKYRPAMDFVTEDNIHHLFLREPAQALDVTLPKEQPGMITSTAFTATENDVFFIITKFNKTGFVTPKRFSGYDEYTNKELHVQIDLYKLNQNGTLDNVNHYEWTRPGGTWKQSTAPVSKYKPYVTAFSPPPYDWAWHRYYVEISNYYNDYSIPLAATTGIVRESRPLNTPFNLLISIAIMGFTLWHGLVRRTSWAKLIFWVILTGLLNLAGLLTYLALNHTPAIKCPACGKKRGLEMDNCVHCGSPLPIPQRKPTDLIMAN